MLISGEGYAPQQRILARKDYQNITRFSATNQVEKKHSTYFLAFIKPSDNEIRTFCRLGITVSKRISKRAVDRNLIKRHVREVFRRHDIRFKNIDLVIIAKPNAKANMNELQTDINKLLSHILHRLSSH